METLATGTDSSWCSTTMSHLFRVEKRREVLGQENRPEPAWSVWGNLDEKTITKVLVISTRKFGETRVLMNHPQGVMNFPSLRYPQAELLSVESARVLLYESLNY